MEEKVFAMLQTTQSSPKHISPARSQSMPSFENPSPTPSQRESGVSSWWSVAKNRLTPTKEPLTAAQQVIQEAKEKERRGKKEAKKAEKDKKRSGEWPASPENKYNNPTLLSLTTPPKPSPNHSAPSAPSSPTPGSQGLPSSLPASLAPSPLRPPDARTSSPSRSPSREPHPLYAQFNEQGTLDVPGTLLVIARRFEKLEKWTVGHVRALEERMSDVERWLVEKESEKENEASKADGSAALEVTVNEMRDEFMEMQGRIGELGREVAKLVISPVTLSSTPSRVSAQAVSTAPQTNSSFAIHAQTSSSITVHSHSLPPNTPTPQPSVSRMSSYGDLRRRDSVSPPFVPPSALRAEQPRSRLPYPTGDYTSPPGSVIVAQGALSPPQSPPTTNNSASASPASAAVRSRPVSVAGLPAASPSPSATAPSGLPRIGGSTLVAPQQPPRARSASISPTPRKRYTVALGEPIMKPRMSASPPPISAGGEEDTEEEEDTFNRTIGRSAGSNKGPGPMQQQKRKGVGIGIGIGNGNGNWNGDDTDTSADSVPTSSPPRRSRAQTSGGARTNPLRLRSRAQSTTDRIAFEDEGDAHSQLRMPWSATATSLPTSAVSAGFRDPLVVRREENEARAKAVPPPPRVISGKPRAPVGELVAFFDKS
ncbi:hypothetical protein B0F90DRAFT_1762074 [Multifurca ochricompacta]|uniref:Uncharacterized protein n=1 Tax=Multifurca ochricompacta TaxID=376703 RepID=A0AAD4QK48_9AGAM|nr:hypothetical protein B0F90DRAFT_1762074 [Multifurca ochricompacta]